MSEPVYLKISCGSCDGHIAYPDSSAGQTVLCPHCSKNVFLPYQSVAPEATEAPPVRQPNVAPKPSPAPAKQAKAGVDFFGKIDCRETALKIIRAVVVINIVFLLLNLVYGYLNHTMLLSVVSSLIYAIATIFLGVLKSRASAIMLSITAFGCLILYVYQSLQDSSMYLAAFFQLLYTIATIRAVEATCKFNGRFTDGQQASSKMPLGGEIALGVAGAIIAYFALIGSVLWVGSTAHRATSAEPAQIVQVESPPPVRQTVSPVDDTPSQETQQSEPETARLNYEWNTTEIDAVKNGNIAVAINWINRKPALRGSAIFPQAEYIAKTPYRFYGKVVRLTGTVAVVQDFPAGSGFSQALGGHDAADIVMSSQDDTIVELFCMNSSGSMKVGDAVNLYGYPVGVLDVENRLGGKDVHLVIVGNDFDDLGASQ